MGQPQALADAWSCLPAVLYREGIKIGETDLTPQQVQQVVQELGQQYKGNTYHLLERNCNHFSSDLCKRLTGKPAPLWVSIACRCKDPQICEYPTWKSGCLMLLFVRANCLTGAPRQCSRCLALR